MKNSTLTKDDALAIVRQGTPSKGYRIPTKQTTLSFDGKGINGPDEYRSRIATFADDKAAKEYGEVFAAALETQRERDILKHAVRKIADCDAKSCEKYVAVVDGIAIDVLAALVSVQS